MVSLKTIAKTCGVSTATVSKALNDQRDIGEETRNRIKKTAEELGYFPNAAARALKTNRSYNIGVLFEEEAGSGLTHEYFSGVLNGLKVQAESQGYDITFINTCFGNRKISYYEHCRYRNFAGVAIVCANDFNDPEVQKLMNSDLPVVTIDYVHHNCTAVCSNNIQGMEELVKYIYRQGHRKIAYIHGQSSSYVTKDRLASFYRTMEELGLTVPDEYVRPGAYLQTKEAARETENLLQLREAPTCIIYPDDTALIGGRNVIIEKGFRIPENISVAGYDGTRISQLLHPKFTTIRQDTERIGSEAAKRLIDTIENPRTAFVERVVIDGILVPGQSVGKNLRQGAY
ncbi:MAG: LacI family DNA-binding transcriptional regulator [Roseburia sp.]|nr:LacI family DNA-binding transcriptional regulator [Roseburia sp.]